MQKSSEFDYIIVGQGLAGSALSYHLLKEDKSVLVIDNDRPDTSSKVAAGIFNPVTGRKMVKTWAADQLFPYLKKFYKDLELVCGTQFFREIPIYRPFISTEEQNEWMGKSASEEFLSFIKEVHGHSHYSFTFDFYGGVELAQAGFLDVQAYLSSYRKYLVKQGALETTTFKEQDFSFNDRGVRYAGYTAKHIIFCEGPDAVNNTFFNWLPFHPVKGEIIYIESNMPAKSILNRGVFVVPIDGGLFKVGSTYDHADLTTKPTEKARINIENRLRELIRVPFKVVRQEAGIRPATKDRRPFVGLHPEYKPIGVLNGLGTKGVSLAPYFAKHFVDFLEHGQQLLPEVNVSRYFSLYYDSLKME